MSSPVLVFDIESIPDIAGLRALRDMPADNTDEQVYAAWLAERKEKGQSDFMHLHLQRSPVISAVFRNAEGLRIHSFVDRDGRSEGKVIQTFSIRWKNTCPSWSAGTAARPAGAALPWPDSRCPVRMLLGYGRG